MILLCLAQGCTLKCSPFIVNIDSIIDVHVQYLGSGEEEEGGKREKERRGGKGGLHDLLHLFNTPLVIHNFNPSFWSEHDHRAVAAVFVHKQKCKLCVSDLKIHAHGAASSVGERIITLDAVTQHTLQIHTVMDFLCRN